MKIKTVKNQTVLDLALQYYGTAEAMTEIIDLNPRLRNDNKELISLGYSLSDFYLDMALKDNQEVEINPESILVKKNITKKINTDITTYQKWQEL